MFTHLEREEMYKYLLWGNSLRKIKQYKRYKMNYVKIHDSIIDRSISRNLSNQLYYENHHIIPKCEGGDPNVETVRLTLKEHRVVHKLRYKMTGVAGNICAYNMMKYGESGRIKNARFAASRSHDPNVVGHEKYKEKQRKAGMFGGRKSYESKSGFHGLSEHQKKLSRQRGRETTVKNKLGMFSDEYRKIHREKMKKIVEVDNMIFNSCTEAARHFNVSRGTISYWIERGKAKIIHQGELSHKGKK